MPSQLCRALLALLALQLLPTAVSTRAGDGREHDAIVRSDSCPATADARRVAVQICGGDAVNAALRRIGLPNQAADVIGDQMAAMGLRTALDLRLLAGTPEVGHLFASLTDSGVSIGARAKVRVLVASDERPTSEIRSLAMGANAQQSSHLQAGVLAAVRRRLQQESQQTDLVQAWSARRAEAASAEQQREGSATAAQAQREHQRSLVQIARTERWIDECAHPILQCLSAYQRSRVTFVGVAAVDLQREHPETFALSYSESHSMANFRQEADGSFWFEKPGYIIFDPKRPKASTATAQNNGEAMMSYAPTLQSLDVAANDSITCFSNPFCGWLPTFILEILSSDPDTILAHEFRSYVRCELLPRLRQLADIVTAQGALVKLPPNEWLYKRFPNEVPYNKADVYLNFCIVLACAWESVILEWDAGRLFTLVPKNILFPFAALRQVMLWSLQQGEAQMQQLVGMTSNRANDANSANPTFVAGQRIESNTNVN